MHEPTLDSDLGDPLARDARVARARGDLMPTLHALAATRGRWDRRWFLLDRLDGSTPRHLFDQAVAAHPQEPLVYLLRGVHAIAWAWLARGRGWWKDVSPERARLFEERCAMAAEDLARASALDADDPTPWAFSLRAGFALQWSNDRAKAVFDEARRRDPEHLFAYEQMLLWLSAKWYGDAEQMFAFARWAIHDAPPGSVCYGLLIRAHLEHQASIGRDQGDSQADVYMASVRAEVAWARAQGVGHPQHARSEWSPITHQHLLRWHYFARDREAMRTELAALGPRLDAARFGADFASGLEEVVRMRRYASGPPPTPASPRARRRGPLFLAGLVGAALAVSLLMRLLYSLAGL